MACRYGQDAKAVAGAVREGVKQVYYVADGADGVRGWRVSTYISPPRKRIDCYVFIAFVSRFSLCHQQVCFLKLYSQLGTLEKTAGVAAFAIGAHCQAVYHAAANTAKLACLLPVLISTVSRPDVCQVMLSRNIQTMANNNSVY